MARLSSPPAPAAPTPAAPADPRHRQRKQSNRRRGAGCRRHLAGHRQTEVRIDLCLRRILGRSHANGFGKRVKPFMDSFDLRLVVLVAQLARALLFAGRTERLLETLDRFQVGSSGLLAVRIARDLVKTHLVGHLEGGVEVVERGFGADRAVDDQPAVLCSRHNVGIQSLQASFLPADRDGLRTGQQARHVSVEIALVEIEGIHHGVAHLTKNAPTGDSQSRFLREGFRPGSTWVAPHRTVALARSAAGSPWIRGPPRRCRSVARARPGL